MDGVATEQTSANEIVCESNHLTSFAILVSTQQVSLTNIHCACTYSITAALQCVFSVYKHTYIILVRSCICKQCQMWFAYLYVAGLH